SLPPWVSEAKVPPLSLVAGRREFRGSGCWRRRLRHGGLQTLTSIGPCCRPINIDIGDNGKADEQRILVRVVILKLYAHRQSLHHFDEIARGILGRQQSQRRACAERKTCDPAREDATAAIHVGVHVDRLTDTQILQLCL